MIISNSESTFEKPEPGVYPARLFRMYDLGTQVGDYQGKVTHLRKIMLTFELLGDEKMLDGNPFVVARRFTASLGEKAALRGFIGAWRGKALTDDEVKAGFDLKRLLGAPCLLNLAEIEREGRSYVNIVSISPLPKGMTTPAGVNPVQHFDLSVPDWNIYGQMSERLQETIAASPEYQAAISAKNKTTTPTPPANSEAFGEDDIPF